MNTEISEKADKGAVNLCRHKNNGFIEKRKYSAQKNIGLGNTTWSQAWCKVSDNSKFHSVSTCVVATRLPLGVN
jgi:hypothetical protein